jgi:hypothetical protein
MWWRISAYLRLGFLRSQFSQEHQLLGFQYPDGIPFPPVLGLDVAVLFQAAAQVVYRPSAQAQVLSKVFISDRLSAKNDSGCTFPGRYHVLQAQEEWIGGANLLHMRRLYPTAGKRDKEIQLTQLGTVDSFHRPASANKGGCSWAVAFGRGWKVGSSLRASGSEIKTYLKQPSVMRSVEME